MERNLTILIEIPNRPSFTCSVPIPPRPKFEPLSRNRIVRERQLFYGKAAKTKWRENIRDAMRDSVEDAVENFTLAMLEDGYEPTSITLNQLSIHMSHRMNAYAALFAAKAGKPLDQFIFDILMARVWTQLKLFEFCHGAPREPKPEFEAAFQEFAEPEAAAGDAGLSPTAGDETKPAAPATDLTASLDSNKSPKIHTGCPGRPTARHLFMAELRRRDEAGEKCSTIGAEAAALREWLINVHPDIAAPTARSIENAIRPEFRRANEIA